MSESNETQMNALHALLVEDLLKKIRGGEATAAELNVARQLLKDNGIEAVIAEGNQLGSLVTDLPFAGLESVKYKN
jgi:soluble P-type ATPase